MSGVFLCWYVTHEQPSTPNKCPLTSSQLLSQFKRDGNEQTAQRDDDALRSCLASAAAYLNHFLCQMHRQMNHTNGPERAGEGKTRRAAQSAFPFACCSEASMN